MTPSVLMLLLNRAYNRLPAERLSVRSPVFSGLRSSCSVLRSFVFDLWPSFITEISNDFSPSACSCESIVSGTTGVSSANRNLLKINNCSSNHPFCAGFSPLEAQTFHVGFSVEFSSNSRLGRNVPGEHSNSISRTKSNCSFATAEGRSPPWKTTVTRARSPD
jgi:hypothetical protein